ncbi:serine protease Do [Rhodobium orientis]|uniref:Probable periplasmic serine endoprotease DegP-like n=1 Tax=Rhodobium orientis TaxID=34017 RepID=A0A327JI01_9HYPH|nr:Do family serine endopeptidase [Rhodobium orientis]MBB4305057.1 serine protease Do [Rhodobium orientis]MBK5949891.1 serine protease [Rhodobium orientis]RAI24853.1 serine protease [Rhodobium orientis]
MTNNSPRRAGWTAAIIPSSKRALMASVLALGVAGGMIGQSALVQSTPAFAESAQTTMKPFSFADLAEKVSPAVVSISVKTEATPNVSFFQEFPDFPDGHPLERFFRRFGEERFGNRGDDQGKRWHQRRGRHPYAMAQGSGFLISSDGYIVTNNHVVDNAEEVTVTVQGGKTYTAKVIGTDKKTDLALVKIEDNGGFPFVSFADKDVRVGDWVMAVGNPFGLGGTVTSGIVSARGRDIGAGPYDDFLQIDAPINRGNSGGPTFDLDGNVVGVNTAIYSPSGGSIGIGFAIPASTVKQIVADLKDDGKVVRGWLGVHIQSVTGDIADSLALDEPTGALVAEVQPNSPAEKAGLKTGDVVTAVDGEKIDNSKELARVVAGYQPDSTVKVEVLRGGKTRTIDVKLGRLNDRVASADSETGNEDGTPSSSATLEDLGIAVVPAAGTGAADEGVVITDIDPDSDAAARGLKVGDVILEVAGTAVESPSDVARAIDDVKGSGRKAALLRVQNGDTARFVAIPLSRG